MQAAKLSGKGQLTIPQRIREQLGLTEGSVVTIELRADGILIRPTLTRPVDVETYTKVRQAEFLLTNAVDESDYLAQREVVRKDLGLDPDTVPHTRPGKP